MEKVIHIFDMDDSLIETPTFVDFLGAEDGEIIDITRPSTLGMLPGKKDVNLGVLEKYFNKVKTAFIDVLSKQVYFVRSGDFVVPINSVTNKPFPAEMIKYFTADSTMRRMFSEKDGVLVMQSFPGFHSYPSTIGKAINPPVLEAYKNADNKMILTGRDVELSEIILGILDSLGIERPNYGLHTYQSGPISIIEFKIKTILESIKINEWNMVHFYEDKKDWLNAAETAVNQTYPSVTFIAHYITNIKEKRRLNMT